MIHVHWFSAGGQRSTKSISAVSSCNAEHDPYGFGWIGKSWHFKICHQSGRSFFFRLYLMTDNWKDLVFIKLLECGWLASSIWDTKREALWTAWRLFYGDVPIMWSWVRQKFVFLQCHWTTDGNSLSDLCRYLRDFEVETIGLKETSRKCSNAKCGAKLKDTVLDWEVSFLFPSNTNALSLTL